MVSEDSANDSAFFLQYSGADRRWAFSYAGGRALAAGSGEPKPGQWYHLVGVRDIGSSSLIIYVNGVRAGSLPVLGNADLGTADLLVGRGQFGGKPVDYLAGAVDEVHAYNRALSAPEVALLYDAAKPAGAARKPAAAERGR